MPITTNNTNPKGKNMCDEKKAPEIKDTVRFDLQDFAATADGIAEALTGAASAAKKVIGSAVVVHDVNYRPASPEGWDGGTAHVLRVIFKSAPKASE